jgi:hypothetical protein
MFSIIRLVNEPTEKRKSENSQENSTITEVGEKEIFTKNTEQTRSIFWDKTVPLLGLLIGIISLLKAL